MTGFKIVIPARAASSRLPDKPLLHLAGEPMIAHVCRQALKADADEVVVATDDARIAEAARGAGVEAVLTCPSHTSGTERIEETARLKGWDDDTIVVNWQGDEPLLDPRLVNRLACDLDEHPDAMVATLAAPASETEIFNPNAVKVVMDQAGYALYFSRAPIPWHRESFATDRPDLAAACYWRHIGVYAYRVGLLHRYVHWPPAPLEQAEALEQLRILWHGERIVVLSVEHAPEPGVDTREDLERVDHVLRQRQG
ncbi:3-deoxy-manno-octulosonate cytidylyltransferase [Methylomarinovum caldicuralii]|uniref:3-deoxy-manno-octulosonate cytidylyltransferase n=1 Tax=Methylomarinovum caldicuralii TaxID=438856 RepID=A0AAU9CT65_9GAMM|nr:3-deoxy-manno-octulosonate cytidylyltransferase [Methylomarinovum caldicuralii]BCX81112.1 3-deoxy-manno-octulosonate cytidylyltransferase [Methylomarinovum caldicuralii]